MSTKSSIAHGPDFHLYREAFDEENVHLSMDGVEFKAEANRVMVSIPIHIWEVIRRYGSADLSLIDKDDNDILVMVEKVVDGRISDNGDNSLVRIGGSLIYGDRGDPREDQIKAGILHFKVKREGQLKIHRLVEDLIAKQGGGVGGSDS